MPELFWRGYPVGGKPFSISLTLTQSPTNMPGYGRLVLLVFLLSVLGPLESSILFLCSHTPFQTLKFIDAISSTYISLKAGVALAGKKLDLAAFSKTNIIAKPTGTIATPQNPQAGGEFGYYFQKRFNINATASPPSYLTNAHKLR